MTPRKLQHNRGAAMMILVVFMLFISMTIIIGIVTPVVREFKLAHTSFDSKQSYFTAESGVEDAMYRIKNSKQISSSETLVLGTSSTTTTITDLGSGQKEIASLGDTESYQRKVDLVLATTAGASFNYGVQIGQGGLTMSGTGVVNGSVYSNGPISSDSSSSITGTAISANSPALSADQSNGSGTPAYNVSFANASSTQDIAQSFQLSASSPLNKVQFYIKKNGSPSNATVKIVADSSGSPATSVLASGTLTASSVTTSYGWLDISFTTNPTLDTATTYWVVIDANASSSNYYIVGASSGGYANGIGKIGQLSGTWNATSPSGLDYFFKVYLGGINGSISGTSQYNQLSIGSAGSGSAQAHTVNYVSASGTIYCQSGTGNNKSCTSQTDPSYISMPISDANITQWEADAAAGGTISGSYSVPWNGATIGPKKITGNLTVSGGATLTVTGTLWVTGDIDLSGGGTIQLASSYGTNDGIIIADGTISVSGGGHATGSGTTGSYIMMMTLDSSSSAASVSGGAGAVILYAPNGTLTISGGASLKEATAYQVSLSGGSTVTYESGLANLNFSSGPSGSWNVQSWKETQ